MGLDRRGDRRRRGLGARDCLRALGTAMSAVIETSSLTKRYRDLVAVNNLSFSVEQGEIFGFLGPNGAGKTTTILMLLGLSEPTSGQAKVCGFDPTYQPLEVKKRVGYLRSEEHTSELQSQSNLVCRLLLEKKKKKK